MKKILFVLMLASLGAAEPKFDWSTVLNVPPGTEFTTGHQILHFKSKDRPYTENEESSRFVEEYLQGAVVFSSDAEVLRFGSDHVKLKGIYLELGVCTGKTVNFIAALNPHQKVYGFDSLEGLPEDWVRQDRTFPAGTFGFKDPGMLPPVLHNVELVKGWFENTLPDFDRLIDPEDPIALMHVDSDIYSSAATAFKILGHRIRPGTILVFDELYNYPGSEDHEFKALQEFLAATGLGARYLAFNSNHEQVAVEIFDRREMMHRIHETIQKANEKFFQQKGVRIDLLKNCPQVIPELAQWLYDEWHPYDKALTVEKLKEGLKKKLNDDQLPLMIVALRDEKPVGMISLKKTGEPELADLEDGNPWGGSFHVIPEERSMMVGVFLGKTALALAHQMGYKKINFYTSNPQNVPRYLQQGATILEERPFRGHTVTIMFVKTQDL